MPANDTLARRISLSPNWYYYKLAVAYSFNYQQTKSETIENALKKELDALPELTKKKLISLYDDMTEEERKYPHKIQKEKQ